LAGAGLREVRAKGIAYPIHLTVAVFLEMRETSTAGRFLRARVEGAVWERFREEVAGEFAARFRDPVTLARTAWIAVGRK
ncbi:MAG TPA: hypothetical protein VF234_05765, partial [Limnochordia bacterium]